MAWTTPFGQGVRLALLMGLSMGLSACSPGEGDGEGELAQQAHAACRSAQVLFLNFDGAQVRGASNCEDARVGCSAVVAYALGDENVSIPAFSGSPRLRQQIVESVSNYYRRFNVQIVTARPAQGTYSMVLIGGHPSLLGLADPVAGYAPLDCDNRQESNIAFTFSDGMGNDPAGVAQSVAQESAHAYGLGHVDDPSDVMFVGASTAITGFHDRNMRIPDGMGCAGLPAQNDVALLRANVGMACGEPTDASDRDKQDSPAPASNPGPEILAGSCSAIPGARPGTASLSVLLLVLGLVRRQRRHR